MAAHREQDPPGQLARGTPRRDVGRRFQLAPLGFIQKKYPHWSMCGSEILSFDYSLLFCDHFKFNFGFVSVSEVNLGFETA